MAKRIIVVEDEPLVAFDIEEAVLEAGFTVVGIARTVDEGLRLLETGACDGAVLDANLNGKSVQPVLAALEAKNLPHIVVSGYTREQLEFLNVSTPLLGKPFRLTELVSNIRKHLGGDSQSNEL